MNARTAQRRGQASVEMALGLIVFVTILMFGIHFAETSYLGMRVSGAAQSAIFRATGQRAHEKGSNFSRASTVAGLTTSDNAKYWDDFQPTVGEGAGTITHVLTKIEKSTNNVVRCTNEGSMKSSLVSIAPTAYSGDRGGLKCSGEAQISVLPTFPKNFLDNTWSLKTAHYSGPTSLRMCATPRSKRSGPCGQFGVLLGDYALQGASSGESRANDLFNGGNSAFKALVDGSFMYGGVPISPMCAASAAMLGSLKLVPQLGPCFSQLSFKGHEVGFNQSMGGHHVRSPWNTAGYKSQLRQKNNKAYYLGRN
ncbi:MAG: pilus assembly protein [Deltaproteobacteria bacterium]|nr:pilus assembly protein [Deltaproteobacteria bacterium]